MKHQKLSRKQDGFTLVEIIVVLAIMSTIAILITQKYIDVATASMYKAIETEIVKLNSRESITWTKKIISNSGYDNDQNIVNDINYDLGDGYTWSIAPSQTGGTIEFQGLSASLTRAESDISKPAVWSLQP